MLIGKLALSASSALLLNMVPPACYLLLVFGMLVFVMVFFFVMVFLTSMLFTAVTMTVVIMTRCLTFQLYVSINREPTFHSVAKL